jgi:8-oxo-dGTP pyrophosphatase MutT (NUDIX family)
MIERARFPINVCVVLHRDGRWLLNLRADDASYAAGTIGLIGGHVEPSDGPERVLECAVQREVTEETGIDLTGIPLVYLDSEAYRDNDGDLVLTVTYAAELPLGVEPVSENAVEDADLSWWTLEDLEADPRCAPWTSRLVRRALATITSS